MKEYIREIVEALLLIGFMGSVIVGSSIFIVWCAMTNFKL